MTLEEIGQCAIALRRATLAVATLQRTEDQRASDARRAQSEAERVLNAAIDEYEEQGQYGHADGKSEMD